MIVELDIVHVPDRALEEIREGMQTLKTDTGRILSEAMNLELEGRASQQGHRVKLGVSWVDVPLADPLERELVCMWASRAIAQARQEGAQEREQALWDLALCCHLALKRAGLPGLLTDETIPASPVVLN